MIGVGGVQGPSGAATMRARVLPRQQMVARDGVRLCTDVYLPLDEAPAPSVVVRTPYGRHAVFLQALALRLSRAGFAVVVQDSRGRYQSEGTFELRRETADGFDTLQWLARQRWSDGQAALIGLSITGLPNFQLALDVAPSGVRIAALVNVMGVVDIHSLFYRNGALLLHWALPWCTMMSGCNMGRTGWQRIDWPARFREHPLASAMSDVPGDTSQLWHFALDNPAHGGAWTDYDVVPGLPSMRVPVLHLSGWHDFMLGQVLLAYDAIARGRAPQQLVIGPWDHQTVFSAFAGARQDEGGAAPHARANLLETVVAWLQRCLSRTDRPAEGDARVALYVMEAETWIDAQAFPPPPARVEDWFLGSHGRANTAAGDGRLLTAPLPEVGHDSFAYDPQDPIATAGGAIWPFPPANLVPGSALQHEAERRPSVLVYTGDTLREPLIVAGPVSVELWAATSVCDTDFTAKLVDVDAAGLPRIVQDGIVRARFAGSRSLERLLEPHRPYRFAIDLQATAHCFQRGHRVRLEISSSNFPKFDRSLNSSAARHGGTAAMVAAQTVFHGGAMASRLRLPVMASADPRAAAPLRGQP